MAAERQTRLIRCSLFRSICRQEIGWFDVYKSGELTNRLTDDITKIKDGIGDKLGACIQYTAAFISGIIIGCTERSFFDYYINSSDYNFAL